MFKKNTRMIALLLVLVLCMSFVGCKGKTEGNDSEFTDSVPDLTSSVDSEDGELLTSETDGSSLTSSDTDSAVSTGGTVSAPQKNQTYTNLIASTGSKQEKLFGDLRGTKLYISESDNSFTNSLMSEFKKKYGVDVINLNYSYIEEQSKLATIVQSGDKKNYMDVVTLGSTTILKYLSNNLIMPIDDYLDKNDPSWKNRETPNGAKRFEGFQFNGKTYGSSSNGWGGMFIYYNKTYLEEKGIKDPYTYYYKNGNWTFDTFLQVAKAALEKSSNGKSVKTYGISTWDYMSFLEAAGNTGIVQKPNGKWEITIDQPDGMAGLNLLHELYKAGTFGNCSATDFTKRKVAMIIGTANNILQSTSALEVMSDEVGFVPLPKKDKNSKQYIVTVPEGRGIAACSQNPRAAMAWIYEFQRAELVRDNSSYGLTVRRSFIPDKHLKIRQEFFKSGTEIHTYIDGLNDWYDKNRGLFFSKITTEGKAPASVIDQMLPILKDSMTKTFK